nr:ras-related protein Rab-7L1-like [Lytechinus pictus]
MNLADGTEEVDEKFLKIIIIGDSLVGKSSFVESFINSKFRRTKTGVDFAFKIVKFQDQVVKLQLWDINGQLEKCSSIRRLYYRDASACVIIFDVTQRKTFDSVIDWRKNVTMLSNVRSIPCLLLANKIDLPSPIVNDEEIEELCKQNNFIGWCKVSVPDRTNIDKTMQFLVEKTLISNG